MFRLKKINSVDLITSHEISLRLYGIDSVLALYNNTSRKVNRNLLDDLNIYMEITLVNGIIDNR